MKKEDLGKFDRFYVTAFDRSVEDSDLYLTEDDVWVVDFHLATLFPTFEAAQNNAINKLVFLPSPKYNVVIRSVHCAVNGRDLGELIHEA